MNSNNFKDILAIKSRYRTSVDKEKVVSEFYEPCLRKSITYKRAAGFYSSASLLFWAESLVYFHNPNKKIFLLTSPILSSHDQNLIQEIEDVEERIKFQSTQLETLIKDAVNDVSILIFLIYLNG